MIPLALLLIQAAPVNPFAKYATGPAKMFIIANNGVTIADYPTMERCEVSRVDMLRQAERENAATPTYQTLPNGGTVITAPFRIRAFCFRA